MSTFKPAKTPCIVEIINNIKCRRFFRHKHIQYRYNFVAPPIQSLCVTKNKKPHPIFMISFDPFPLISMGRCVASAVPTVYAVPLLVHRTNQPLCHSTKRAHRKRRRQMLTLTPSNLSNTESSPDCTADNCHDCHNDSSISGTYCRWCNRTKWVPVSAQTCWSTSRPIPAKMIYPRSTQLCGKKNEKQSININKDSNSKQNCFN